MSEIFEGRPVVLTKEQTEAKHAAQQNNQNQTVMNVDNKTIQLDVSQDALVKGDVLEEAPTVLDSFISTDKTTYTVEDTAFKNDITGQTGILAKESIQTQTPEAGVEMFFNH